MGASSTAAGMKKYKPRREPGSLNDMVYSESKQAAMNEAKEAKDTARNEADYNKSLTTENKAKGGYVKAADGCCSKGKTRGKMV